MLTATRTPFATPANDNGLANAVRHTFDPRCESAIYTPAPIDRLDRQIVGKIGVACVGLLASMAGAALAAGVANLIGGLF